MQVILQLLLQNIVIDLKYSDYFEIQLLPQIMVMHMYRAFLISMQARQIGGPKETLDTRGLSF